MTAKAVHNPKNGVQITIAWIGLIGTVITVMGTILVAAVNNRKVINQSPVLPTPVVFASPVVLLPPVLLTSTVIQPTPTSAAGDYLIPGQDWSRDCIGPSWVVFPYGILQRDQNGCLQQPLPGIISTQNGNLSLLSQAQADSAQVYGISTPLPFRSNVDMHLTLNQIQNGQVWIGILDGSDPLKSQGMMMVMSDGDVRNQVFVIRQIPQGHELLRSASIPAEIFNDYDVHLVIDNGSMTIKINSLQTMPLPLSFVNRQLFIGCRNQFGFNLLNAQVSHLTISGN